MTSTPEAARDARVNEFEARKRDAKCRRILAQVLYKTIGILREESAEGWVYLAHEAGVTNPPSVESQGQIIKMLDEIRTRVKGDL